MDLPFALPPTLENGPCPLWTGTKFLIGNEQTNVLHYSTNNQGWNDNLTNYAFEEVTDADYFMHKASRMHTLQQLKATLKHPQPTILEIGCATGFMLKEIYAMFPQATVIGSDVVYDPLLKLAGQLPIPLLRFDLLQCPLPDNSIDAIVCLNVLEHIEDDQAALDQIYRILKPGGVFIIEVPAGPHLYDIHDEMYMHFRRYKLSHLCQLLKQKCFTLLKQSHLGVFIYPAFWLVKQKNKRLLAQPEAVKRQLVEKSIRQTGNSKILSKMIALELALGRFMSYPFGIRCLVSCVK